MHKYSVVEINKFISNPLFIKKDFKLQNFNYLEKIQQENVKHYLKLYRFTFSKSLY